MHKAIAISIGLYIALIPLQTLGMYTQKYDEVQTLVGLPPHLSEGVQRRKNNTYRVTVCDQCTWVPQAYRCGFTSCLLTYATVITGVLGLLGLTPCNIHQKVHNNCLTTKERIFMQLPFLFTSCADGCYIYYRCRQHKKNKKLDAEIAEFRATTGMPLQSLENRALSRSSYSDRERDLLTLRPNDGGIGVGMVNSYSSSYENI